ncbi:hypothetical protein [Mycobacterium sp.]|uniref:hypothetical protein n=1 Tax=Mycobacterium sp. TaxID=1785 RepID=UPI003F9B51D4
MRTIGDQVARPLMGTADCADMTLHKLWPAFFCVKLWLTIFMLSPTVVPLLKVERRPCSYSTDARLRLDLHA